MASHVEIHNTSSDQQICVACSHWKRTWRSLVGAWQLVWWQPVHTALPLARCSAMTPSMFRGNRQDGQSAPVITAVLKQSRCDSWRQHGRVVMSLRRGGVLQLPSQKMHVVVWSLLRYLEILIQQKIGRKDTRGILLHSYNSKQWWISVEQFTFTLETDICMYTSDEDAWARQMYTHLSWFRIFLRRIPVFITRSESGAISRTLPRWSKIWSTLRHLASFTIPTRRLRLLGTAQRAGSGIPRYPSTSGSTNGSSRISSLGWKKMASTWEASTIAFIVGSLYTACLQQAVIWWPTPTNSSWER